MRRTCLVVLSMIALSAGACARRTRDTKPDVVPLVADPAIVPEASIATNSALDASNAPEPPPDSQSIALDDPNLRAWIEERMAQTRAGHPDRVRIPLVRQSTGWGCVCPPHYVGVDPNTEQGPWLDVTFAKGVRALRPAEVVLAEGTFGGEKKHVRYPNGPPPSGSWEYDLVPFAVTKTTPLPEASDEDPPSLERL
jgi:hypothetical protein